MLSLLEDENIILESRAEKINFILTNQRLYQDFKQEGLSKNEVIYLKDIRSLENRKTKNIALLILGVLSIVSGGNLASKATNDMNLYTSIASALVGGTLFIGLYILTRKHFLIIGTASGDIKVNVRGMPHDRIIQLMDRIEEAKKSARVRTTTDRVTY